MNHATHSSRPFFFAIVLIAMSAAGFLVIRQRSMDESMTARVVQNDSLPTSTESHQKDIVTGDQSADSQNAPAAARGFFDPPPQRAFPDQDGYPRSGVRFGPCSPDTFEGDLDALPREMPPRWQQPLVKGLAIAGFVLKGPPPTKPLACYWYYVRFIPIVPWIDGDSDSRVRELNYPSENFWNGWEDEIPEAGPPPYDGKTI